MKNEIIYKGAYLSGNFGEENRKWIFVIYENGGVTHRLFGDLKFWAQRQILQQGFKLYRNVAAQRNPKDLTRISSFQ